MRGGAWACRLGCNGPCQMPAWVIDGWYANNPDKQQLAIARWHRPATTEAERIAAKRDLAAQPAHIRALCEKIKREADGNRLPALVAAA